MRPLFFALTALALSACSTSQAVNMNTDPPGAELWVDGQYVGVTPASYTDKFTDGHYYKVQLKHAGYKPREVTLKQLESPGMVAFAGLCPCARVCMLWSSKLPQTDYTWQLEPEGNMTPAPVGQPPRAYPGAQAPSAFPPPPSAQPNTAQPNTAPPPATR